MENKIVKIVFLGFLCFLCLFMLSSKECIADEVDVVFSVGADSSEYYLAEENIRITHPSGQRAECTGTGHKWFKDLDCNYSWDVFDGEANLVNLQDGIYKIAFSIEARWESTAGKAKARVPYEVKIINKENGRISYLEGKVISDSKWHTVGAFCVGDKCSNKHRQY